MKQSYSKGIQASGVNTHNLILCHENTHTSLQFKINKSFIASVVYQSYAFLLFRCFQLFRSQITVYTVELATSDTA